MAQIDVRMEDNSQKVLEEAERSMEKALFAIGLLGVEGCVEKASEIDSVTGRPTVDTGRYRAGFGFITPTQGRMNGAKSTASEATDNFSNQRTVSNTVIIANNVEYAPYLEFGTGTQEGGHHARYIMKRGIESKIDDMKAQVKQIFEGKDVSLSVSGISGGE